MRLLSWLLCAAAAIVPAFTSEERSISRPKRDSSEKKIVCYYTNWSVYRPGTAKFTPQNINPYLCTHLIYAFGGLSKDNALKPFDKYQDIEQGGYAKFNGLKTYNKNLKTMLAIGGWNEGSARFSPLVADSERRKELVKNTVKFLRQNHFDGLDLDWEYPSFRDGGKPRDRDNYATLVQEFREEFERESEKTGRPRLLLTMAVPAGIEYIDKGYDVPKLNKYLDWMNILSYDYHSAFEPAINHHSPLFSLEEDDEYNFDAALNIDHTVQHYIKLGADKSKLVLGIPTYGRSYSLFNPDATDIGSPADGPGEQGEATREKGYLAYYEICERVSSGGWTLENPNPEAMGPYAYKGNQWVGFDDEDIVRIKAKYVNDNDLGGIMFWSIDNDDFRGKCHGKPYPLIEAAKEALLANANELVPSTRSGAGRSSLKKQEPETKSKTRKTRLRTKSSTTTESSQTKSSGRTTTTPQPPTTPDPGSDFVCKDEGFFPHPRDCKKYFWCLDSGPSSLGIVAHQFTCPSGLVFNKISDSCDYARNVICKTKPESAATTSTTTTTTTTARSTTTRSRVITASPPRTTSTTTTTTTEAPEEEEVEEEEEEDPGTIKELINLIKKLGGVEQLEKQLNLQNSDEKEKIKPSLYSRVLQGRTANRYRGVTGETTTTKYVSVFRNRPVGPQSPSTEEINTTSRGSDKPRYVTIQRNRSTKKPVKVEEESEEEEEEEEVEEQPKPVQETPRSFRRRPNSDTTTEKEYVVLRRSRPQTQKEEDISTPKYKNIVRVRSTTEAAVDKDEDEDLTEEEEEIVEEEEETETEPAQKLKKYSSIIRDNKRVVAEEEETKVSGPQGPQYVNEVSSSTTDSVLDGREIVNNVNTVTSPRYVEIRRTQPTSTETTENNVYSVNNSHDNNQENVDETNEVYESQQEGRENNIGGFQRRITTEIVKRPTRPSFRSSTLASTTPITVETTNNDIKIPRFRERQQPASSTEGSIVSIRPIGLFRGLNRNNPENKVSSTENKDDRLPKQEKPFRSSTTTTTTEEAPSVNDPPRRFQFAPRTKPAILSPKYPESSTETFQITVPDIPNSEITENSLSSASFPSATLEPTTPPTSDTTILGTPEGSIILTTFGEQRPSTNQFIPTTSTQTSVVTSITESSITERKRIFVPKKSRQSESDLNFDTDTFTTERTLETTRPYYRPAYNRINRVTTPTVEVTTEGRKRRFKTKTTTTTTTEEPAPAKKYVAKKTRNFKRITSTEVPEVTSSTTERIRFQPRNKPRHTEGGPFEPSNSLQSRFNTSRRKKILSKKEEDDLEVEQTATFFDDDFDTNSRYILGGALKQSSDKDYLNADILFRTVPTVEEEEKLAEKADEELIKSNRIPVTPSSANDKSAEPGKKELVRNKFTTINPALRNLRTRTRQTTESSPVTEATDTKNFPQTQSNRGINRNNLLTSGPNFRTLRGRTQQFNSDNNIEKDFDDTRSNQGSRLRKFQPNFRGKSAGNAENEENVTPEDADGIFGTKTASTPATTFTRNPNYRNFKVRIREEQAVTEKNVESSVPNDENIEKPKSSFSPRVKIIRRPTESSNVIAEEGDGQNYRNRARNRIFKENGKPTEATPVSISGLPTKSTKSSTVYSTISSQKTTKGGSASEGITVTPSLTSTSLREQSLSNLIVSKTDRPSSSGQVIDEEAFVTDPTVGSTFGIKISSTAAPSTSSTVGTTFGAKIGPTVATTRGFTAGSTLSAKSGYTVSSNTVGSTLGLKSSSTFSSKTAGPALSTKGGSTATFNTVSPTVGSTFSTKGGSTFSSNTSASTYGTKDGFTATSISPATDSRTEATIRGTFITLAPKPIIQRVEETRRDNDEDNEPSSQTPSQSNTKEPVLSKTLTANANPSSFRTFRTRTRQNSTASPNVLEKSEKSLEKSNSSFSPNRVIRTRGKVKAIDSIFQATENGPINETDTEFRNGRTVAFKEGRRRVLVRRPVQPASEVKEEENELEPPEEPSSATSKTGSDKRVNGEYLTNFRTRGKTTTQATVTTERKRTLLDRRRLRGSTTAKPDVQTEAPTTSSRANILLRRKPRPSTTTTTTTTTEEPYVEQQEDSRLEESKALDETPGIQDLADPAVVAIHNLATVSPGPIVSGVTASLNSIPQTPATYTVHVTPADIASFSTTGNIASVTPGTIPSRPTSILTLKPYTVPLITRQYITKQTPAPFRAAAPVRETVIPVVTKEPYSPRGEILIQARKQEAAQRVKPTPFVSTPEKDTVTKARRLKPFSKVPKQEVAQSATSSEPPVDYEYYDDDEDPLANIPASALKVKVHSDGYIECLDRGNFPHPFSCKKFISCAKMENNELLGWEYTCPKHLSFDPVGGICNWSAGLGCQH